LNFVVPSIRNYFFPVDILDNIHTSLGVLDSDGHRHVVRSELELLSHWRGAPVDELIPHSNTALQNSGEARCSEHGGVEAVPLMIHEGVQHISRCQVHAHNFDGSHEPGSSVFVQTLPDHLNQVIIVAIITIPGCDFLAIGEACAVFIVGSNYLEV